MPVLIWVQTVCKGYEQVAKAAARMERTKVKFLLSAGQIKRGLLLDYLSRNVLHPRVTSVLVLKSRPQHLVWICCQGSDNFG